jgi:hypothetical protein
VTTPTLTPLNTVTPSTNTKPSKQHRANKRLPQPPSKIRSFFCPAKLVLRGVPALPAKISPRAIPPASAEIRDHVSNVPSGAVDVTVAVTIAAAIGVAVPAPPAVDVQADASNVGPAVPAVPATIAATRVDGPAHRVGRNSFPKC